MKAIFNIVFSILLFDTNVFKNNIQNVIKYDYVYCIGYQKCEPIFLVEENGIIHFFNKNIKRIIIHQDSIVNANILLINNDNFVLQVDDSNIVFYKNSLTNIPQNYKNIILSDSIIFLNKDNDEYIYRLGDDMQYAKLNIKGDPVYYKDGKLFYCISDKNEAQNINDLYYIDLELSESPVKISDRYIDDIHCFRSNCTGDEVMFLETFLDKQTGQTGERWNLFSLKENITIRYLHSDKKYIIIDNQIYYYDNNLDFFPI